MSRKVVLSFGAFQDYTPKNPERTGYRNASPRALNFDIVVQEWPNRAALLKSIEMQSRGEPCATHWRDFATIMARRAAKAGAK